MEIVASNKPQRHSHYYLETLVFQVDDTLFRVPSRYLFENSEILKDASEISAASLEGSSDANPIKLPLPEDGNAEDFANFLKVIYPLTIKSPVPNNLSKEQWISALKLSTCWMLDEARKLAITNINLSSFIEKVQLGRKFKVRKWVLDGLQGLASASNPLLPLKDLEGLGEGTAMRLLYLRNTSSTSYYGCTRTQDDVRLRGYCNNCGNGPSSHRPSSIAGVEELFANELALFSD
ncbi:hypothetical protein V5O48_002399 [Marasmius crinis-equi]|uniref:BTB domain-containing protein n=1 Tax=Marasmius crinis-equi TaxID=585013 RepID=A0ABR3FVW7_9AGAR